MKTIDISGFGGGYEAGCQKMLLNGLKFLKEHPNFDFKVYKQSPRVFGICIGEGETAKELDKAVEDGVKPSGQCIMQLLVTWPISTSMDMKVGSRRQRSAKALFTRDKAKRTLTQ